MTNQLLGQLLANRYQVIQDLAQGGMGETYVAIDTQMPDTPKCVVKKLIPTGNNQNCLPIAKRLFSKEAWTLKKLGNHKQIPCLLAFIEEENGEFVIVQEYIEGHPLSEEMGQPWDETKVIQLLEEILNILIFIHQEGIIHRDIKPANLLRQPNGKLVLIDFGAVKEFKAQITCLKQTATVVVGTPGYMPTEQIKGKPLPSSDLYALGMVCIQALTGRSPLDLWEASEDENELNPKQFAPTVTKELGEVLTKMVSENCEHRYKSANEALQALQQVKSISPSKTRWWKAAGLGAAFTIVAIAAVTVLAIANPPAKLPLGGDCVLDRQIILGD